MDKLREIVMKNKKEIYKILGIDKIIDENKRLKEIVELDLKKKEGYSSTFKGKLDEQKKKYLFNKYFSKRYNMDERNITKCMDIRLTSKISKKVIGIECKDKMHIKKSDIDKFKKDNVTNMFDLGIFISNDAEIKGIIERKNTFKKIGKELYIYSSNEFYIMIVIQTHLRLLEEDNKYIDNRQTYIDIIYSIYNEYKNLTKSAYELENKMETYLVKLGLTNT
jgi:hypothetical protein